MSGDANLCPCCGQAVARSDVLVSLDSNTVAYDGQVVRLTAVQTEIAYVLARRGKIPVSREFLFEQVYGSDEGRELKTLDVHLARIRRSIAPLGLRIVNVFGRGWLLERAEPREQAAA